MAGALPRRIAEQLPAGEIHDVTLWELVWAVSEEASSEQEVVAAVLHLLRSGRARLCGTFRGCPIAEDEDPTPA